MNIPKEIKGITLSDAQYKDLVEGKAVKVEGMTAKSGKTFDATLQVNAERKGIEFIFDNNRGLRNASSRHSSKAYHISSAGWNYPTSSVRHSTAAARSI